MPRYYFHVYNGKQVLDRHGSEHGDLVEARQVASALAQDMARLSLGLTGMLDSGRVVIADESGNELAEVPLSTQTRT